MLSTALNPSNKLVSIMATPDGKLVTNLFPLPPVMVPVSEVALRVDSQGRLIIYEGV